MCVLGKSESLSKLASRNVGVASSNCLELLCRCGSIGTWEGLVSVFKVWWVWFLYLGVAHYMVYLGGT